MWIIADSKVIIKTGRPFLTLHSQDITEPLHSTFIADKPNDIVIFFHHTGQAFQQPVLYDTLSVLRATAQTVSV